MICGAEAATSVSGYVCSWPDSPLRVWIDRGEPAGPNGLVFAGAPELDAADEIGPAVRSLA